MGIFTRIFIGGALRPFMKPIPGDVAHKKLKPLVYAYVGFAFILFNLTYYLSQESKNGKQEMEETDAEYMHRVFKVQNPTILKFSWSKGLEKEKVDVSKFYTLPDDDQGEEEEDSVLEIK